MTTMEKELTDGMIKFLFKGAPVRGEIVSLGKEWEKMIANHHYPKPVAHLLGQFTAGAMLLSGTIKFDGELILQVLGDGPVSILVVEVKNDLTVRAMAKIREGAEIPEDADMKQLINNTGKGRCAIILDPYDRAPGTQPYQGVVPLDGPTPAAALENYMKQSEQLDTRFWLSATPEKLGGLLIQKMPSTGGKNVGNTNPDALNRIIQLAGTVRDHELLDLSVNEVIHRLFWQEELESVVAEEAVFNCNCSEDRIRAMLKSIGRKELDEILKEEKNIEVKCEFCNKLIVFTPEQIDALFAEDEAEHAKSDKTIN